MESVLLNQTKEIWISCFEYLTVTDLFCVSKSHSRLNVVVRSLLLFHCADVCFKALGGKVAILACSSLPTSFVIFDMCPQGRFLENISPFRKSTSLQKVVALVQNLVSEKTFYLDTLQRIFVDPSFHSQVSLVRVAWGPNFFSFFIFRKSFDAPLCFQVVADFEEKKILQALRPIFDCPCDKTEETDEKEEATKCVCFKHHDPDTVTRYHSEQGWLTCFHPVERYELPYAPTELEYLKDSLLGDCLLSSLYHLEAIASVSWNHIRADVSPSTAHIQTILGSSASARHVLKEELLARYANHFDQVCEKAKGLPKEELLFGVLYQQWLLDEMQRAEQSKRESKMKMEEALVRVAKAKRQILHVEQERQRLVREVDEVRQARVAMERERDAIQQNIDELITKLETAEALVKARVETVSNELCSGEALVDAERSEKKQRKEDEGT